MLLRRPGSESPTAFRQNHTVLSQSEFALAARYTRVHCTEGGTHSLLTGSLLVYCLIGFHLVTGQCIILIADE